MLIVNLLVFISRMDQIRDLFFIPFFFSHQTNLISSHTIFMCMCTNQIYKKKELGTFGIFCIIVFE